ncbi:MAG: Extracellular ligand-binding receptor [Candidatus Nomurabacteria bacterium]|nr:Extracellular ligand-binding receptor [Candidatus Nomurabacteria bacterium]
MKKPIVWGLVIVVILLVIWVIVDKNKSKPATGEPIKIGVATLLTGDYAALGENISNTAKLVIEEVNKNGGINGRPLELYIEDSKVDSKSGLDAIQKLVNVDKAHYIIGGMTSNGTIAGAPIANKQHVIILTPVTGGSNVDNAGDYVFRIANSDVLAGRDLANAMIKMGYTKVGVISAVTEYTLDIKNTFESTMKNQGEEIVISEEFQPGTTDYHTMVSKVRTANPQAVLVLSNLGTDAAYFIKQGREMGYTPPIFTDFNTAANGSVKNILGSLDGIYFTDPKYDESSKERQAFFNKYKEVYGKDPAIPFHSASTYDGIMMLTKALQTEGDDSVKVKDWLLANVKNYHGFMGTYSLDEKGNSDLGFNIKVFKNGKAELVK